MYIIRPKNSNPDSGRVEIEGDLDVGGKLTVGGKNIITKLYPLNNFKEDGFYKFSVTREGHYWGNPKLLGLTPDEGFCFLSEIQMDTSGVSKIDDKVGCVIEANDFNGDGKLDPEGERQWYIRARGAYDHPDMTCSAICIKYE